ncbi:MAG: hypothetical protein N3G20_09095, partial [Verrucomicrobiae bacterium]|nr:hypothetical protein [Verrucomicrobiae bacterium]
YAEFGVPPVLSAGLALLGDASRAGVLRLTRRGFARKRNLARGGSGRYSMARSVACWTLPTGRAEKRVC